jgi:hypothetical protein
VRRLPSILWLLLLLVFVAEPPRTGGAPFYLGGIQVNEPDQAAWVSALEAGGFNTVAVTAYARQGDWDSANLWYEGEGARVDDENGVVHEIRAARRRGLESVLVLRIALDHAFERNKFLWHGMIQPVDEAALDGWFARYRRFVVHWAAIAEREGVDVLAIGSELNSLTRTVRVSALPELEEYWSNAEKVAIERRRLLAADPRSGERKVPVRGFAAYSSVDGYLDDHDAAHAEWARRVAYLDREDPLSAINRRRELLERHWRRLIEETRAHYSGALTYAANFDQYREVGFWDALDLIGINAYFPLLARPPAEPGRLAGDLEASWRAILASIDDFRRGRDLSSRRVLFTEIGYVPRALATVEPWTAEGSVVLPSEDGPRLVVWEEQPVDPEERALAVRGLCRAAAARRDDLLAGLLYWKLSTVPAHREVERFLLVIGPEAPPDPLAEELAACGLTESASPGELRPPIRLRQPPGRRVP